MATTAAQSKSLDEVILTSRTAAIRLLVSDGYSSAIMQWYIDTSNGTVFSRRIASI